jgi:hypothetical protein
MNTSEKILLGAFGVITGTGSAVIVGTLLRPNELQAPFISCDFSDRNEAQTRRDLGVLPKAAVYEACKKAVDNYFEKGLSGYEGRVIIKLPPRAELTGSKQTAQPVTPTP